MAWCSDPARLDAAAAAAGLAIAGTELALAGCRPDPASLAVRGQGSAQARVLQNSAELLRDAQTNGDVFLALPANGGRATQSTTVARCWNAVRRQRSDSCNGPTAAQAEFRTQRNVAASED